MEALMAIGKEVYDRACVLCHQPDGMGLSGSFPPLVAGAPFEAAGYITGPLERLGFYRDGKIALGSVETHIDVVILGIPGTRMFSFAHVLTDEDIAAVVTYERNAWGNDTGDVVTPEQVAGRRP
jgi:cytochrome c oxidase subunit 2